MNSWEDGPRTTIREQTAHTDYYGDVSNVQMQSGKGYLTNTYNAPNTNKQFTQVDYTGGAGYCHPRQTDSYAMQNADINCEREKTLARRGPTPSNVSLRSGADSIRLVEKRDTLPTNQEKILNRVSNDIYKRPCMSLTQTKPCYNNVNSQRNAPGILKAFNDNPYTHSFLCAAGTPMTQGQINT